MDDILKAIDHSALKTNQAAIILVSLLAFVLDLPWLAAVVGLAMGVGTLLGMPAFGFIYRYWLKPVRLVEPDILLDNPQPHRFAQGLGAAFLFAGVLLQWSGLQVPGWSLVWLVIALAALNLLAGFCIGCAVYYWLSRLSIPGFTCKPPSGTFPGLRPPKRLNDGT